MDYVGLKSRIAWVDVFKGIAIMCVVYGHIGFVYNYVYQFHMAAFFFISGYLTLLTKENWVPFVMKKAYALSAYRVSSEGCRLFAWES